MHLAWVSLIALFLVLAVSRYEKINVGILAMALAWVLGFYWAKIEIPEIVQSFPLSLFLILFGVTFFFGLIKNNGTLEKITEFTIRLARGKKMALPAIFFILPLIFALVGVGNIGAVALFAPIAMSIAARVGISVFFMAVMLVNGANAGAFSPFAPTGIVANQLIAKQGLAMGPWGQVFLPSFLAQTFIALCFYVALIRRMHKKQADFDLHELVDSKAPFTRAQIITIAALLVFILGVMFFKADIGFLAITLSAALMLANISDGEAAMKHVPWNIIMMVCGVSTMIAILDKTGGLELFSGLIAKVSSPETVTGVIALVTGVISSYSSSSGVVMPTFIPIVPDLIEKIGGGHAAAIIASVNVGSHVVDISPLSTLGAICIANAGPHENKAKLFQKLLFYGMLMSVFGAVVCYVFFGVLGQWFLI